jgi:hypothetical protein
VVWVVGDLKDRVRVLGRATQRRLAFAELLFKEIGNFGMLATVDLATIVTHALRIGTSVNAEAVIGLTGGVLTFYGLGDDYRRRLYLLVARCAREKSDREVVKSLFSLEFEGDFLWKRLLGVPRDQTLETVDVEAICMSLSYREAMDLRWALEIARRELPDQDATPQPSSPSRRPRKR